MSSMPVNGSAGSVTANGSERIALYYDRAHNVVIHDAGIQAKRITSTIADARQLDNGMVATPCTLYNLQVLRWLGFKVPPIMDINNYDWPGRFVPFQAQRTTANFLVVHPRAFVLSDMGVGKTLSALWAADYIMRTEAAQPGPGAGLRALIVAPLSTLQRVWHDAIFQNFLGRRTATVVYGDAQKRRQLLSQSADFYIINYDGIAVVREVLAQRPDIRMVIIDEASAYRDFGTKRSKLARSLLAPRDYLWLMTGTPTPNGPTDAYGLALLVNKAGGETFTSYKSRVMHQVSRFVWVPKHGSHEAAHRLMQPSVRFAISDCVDLPPCTEQTRDVELSAEQEKAYKDMKRELQLVVKSGPITAVNEAVLRLKLIQIACGAVYGHSAGGKRDTHYLDSKPRLSVLREVLSQCPAKVIIFSGLTSLLHLLYKELKGEHTCAIVNGEVSQKDRSEVFSNFENDANPRIILADPATMSHGLSLTAAATIIWYSPTDRTELFLQANARINRPGQVRNTAVVKLTATSLEREIYRRLETNQSMQGLILQFARGEI